MHNRRGFRAVGVMVPSGARLHEEIEILERRLEQIGPDGHCGYERALIRFFEEPLVRRRALLGLAG